MAARPAIRTDRRWIAIVLTVGAIAIGGTVISLLGAPTPPSRFGPQAAAEPAKHHAADARAREVRLRFEQAVVMLHAHEYEHALTALHRVLELAPELPEAHVNAGFALLGLNRAAAARDFFAAALALAPMQANAYYGTALALEALGDLPGAVGAMRTYLHLAGAGEDPRHLARARAALWEWESRDRTALPGAPVPAHREPAPR